MGTYLNILATHEYSLVFQHGFVCFHGKHNLFLKHIDRDNMINRATIRICLFFMALITLTCNSYAQVAIRSGFEYDWWKSNKHDKGVQLYTPMEAFVTYNNFSARVLTAYVYSEIDQNHDKNRSLSSMIDTKLNLSYMMLNILPVDVLFGLDFNLPTGKTDLDEDELALIMDPDLISIRDYGEGFNINPTISISKVWEKFSAGIGVGYLWRGKYDFSKNAKNYDPGDILSLTGEISYSFTDAWIGRFFTEYAHFTEDELDRNDYFQQGDFLLLGIGIQYVAERWDTAFTVRGIFRDKDRQESNSSKSMLTEDKNSHGDEWIGDMLFRYYLSNTTILKSTFQYLWIDKNDYSSSDPYFVGKRKRYSLGFGVNQKLPYNLEGEMSVKGFIMNIDKNWMHPDNDVTYRGFSIVLSLKKTF